MGTEVLPFRVKRPGREDHHSHLLQRLTMSGAIPPTHGRLHEPEVTTPPLPKKNVKIWLDIPFNNSLNKFYSIFTVHFSNIDNVYTN
jgi:hypothetical protein